MNVLVFVLMHYFIIYYFVIVKKQPFLYIIFFEILKLQTVKGLVLDDEGPFIIYCFVFIFN